MKVLVVGSGGREHALVWQLAQSDCCEALYAAPGNPGMEECAECVNIAADDIEALGAFAQDKKIDLAVIGPEGPLVAGLSDRLRALGIRVFGPSKAAARLEGSKAFMKDLCRRYNIPTAAYGQFSDLGRAKAFIRERGAPIVVKADGLAAGKGVVIANTVEEAEKAASDMLSGALFGAAGKTIIIEEFLTGEEISFFALSDGSMTIPFGTARDYKRAGDGDTGPNTGGMGACSPAPALSEDLHNAVMQTIIEPVIAAMKAEGCPFTGVLFAGLMVKDGKPHVLEFNARFGDPECQALLMLLDCDLLEILDACAAGALERECRSIYWREGASLCIVMAARGYPQTPQTGTQIRNLPEPGQGEGVKIFHAATSRNGKGQIVAAGGRVLNVAAYGKTPEEARARAYGALSQIDWPEGFYRRDIGADSPVESGEEAAAGT